MRATVEIAVLGFLLTGLSCVSRLPIAGSACPCPEAAGYCCGAGNVCVAAAEAMCSDGGLPAAGGGGSSGQGTGGGGQAGTAMEVDAAGSSGTGGAIDAGGAGIAGVSGASGAVGSAGAAGGGGAGASGAAGGGGTAGGGAGSGGGGGAGSAACGPDTCADGCCRSNVCIRARSASTCGQSGALCHACGTCEICSTAGACEIDPASKWTIMCASAVVAAKQPNGATWDPASSGPDGPAPDPFCQFEVVAHQVTATAAAVTATSHDTTSPIWNEDVTPTVMLKAQDLIGPSASWRLWVGDDDGCSVMSGCLAQEMCEVGAPLPSSALTSGTITYANIESCGALTLKFACLSATH